jgi:hypothetical protein
MIDGRRYDAPRPRRRSEEEECDAVGAAGDGDPDCLTGWNEPVELGGETADERRIRSSWRRPRPWRRAT